MVAEQRTQAFNSDMKSLIQLTIVLVFLLNASCIHVDPTEHKTLSLKPQKNLQEIPGPPNLKIKSLIFTDTLFPLETFIKKLLDGEFNEAIGTVNLTYTPSNVDNQLIAELIQEGLVPVYVKIENTGAQSIDINEKNFFLSGNNHNVVALSEKEIPRAFTRFNSKAVVANAYNISTVAVAYIGALIAIGVVTSQSGSQGNLTTWNSAAAGGSLGSPDDGSTNRIINSLNKTTVIDYQHYLIGEKAVAPYSFVEGLLFFRLNANGGALKLSYK